MALEDVEKQARETPRSEEPSSTTSEDPPSTNGEDEKSIAPDGDSRGSHAASDDEDEDDDDDDETPRPTSQHSGVVSRVLSRMTSRSSIVPSPPPDGGLKAWLCVFGAHIVTMNTWGIINSFGVFQSYYVDNLGRPPSDISWVGSFEIFLLFSIGVFSGRMSDAGFFRPVFITGAVLAALGTMMASLCTQYWQTFLAQGLCVGIGNGFMFCPTIAVVSTYFRKKQPLAIGIAACGSGTGGIIYPLLVRALLPQVGFGWTVRAIGFIQGGTLAVAAVVMKPRVPPRKTGRLVDWSSFKELDYTFYTIGAFMLFLGVYVPFFFLAAYARDIQGLSYTTSLNVLVMMNGVGIVGRLIPSWLADRFGTLTVFIPTCAGSALLLFCWPAVSSESGLFGWAALCGCVLGGIQSMFPAALAGLTTDPSKQGTRIGMVFTIVSFSVLIGTPIAGTLISALNGRYLGAQMFGGCSLTIGTLLLIASREVKRRKLNVKLLGKA